MLSIDRLTIVDFGPYRGQQSIVFSSEQGVYLIYGQNGRGKTNLHNAFRYALYGKVLERRRTGSLENVPNVEARKVAGHGAFKTILEFHNEGVPYRLTRGFDEGEHPREMLVLERNGVPFSQDESERILTQIAPPAVSQFFLFDGEQLRQYEDLLDQESEEGTALRDSIERVLGIPIIGHARAGVREVARVAEKQLAEQYAAHDETARTAQALREAQDVRDEMRLSQDAIEERIDRATERVEELEAQLREKNKAERLLGKLDQLRDLDTDLEAREKVAIEAIGDVASGVWKAVLAPSAAQRLIEAMGAVQSAELEQRDAAAALRDRAHLHANHDCPVCHREVSVSLREELLKSVETLTSKEHGESLEELLAGARARVRVLQLLANEDARLVTDRDQALRTIRLSRREAREDIARIEGELAEIGEDEIRKITTERNDKTELIARDRQRYEDGARRLHDQELTIEDLALKLRRTSVRPDSAIELKERVSKDLASLFEGAIDAYRESLRRRVEQRASEIFRELIAEPDYVGLRITETYGLEIIDRDGDVVRRSAGYEHLVALSLIAALQDSAAVRGPVIMDYPFGRLDSENTSRVVAALPRMARQVVLLSFSGEFEREAALTALGQNLVAEFDLERVTSKHTRIEPRRTQ